MKETDQAYIRLQRHLDGGPVGFPATPSGVEINILKHIFTPEEAGIATCLRFRFEPAETIFKRIGGLTASVRELEEILDRIQRKGGIESRIKDGRRQYANAPLVVGMYEMQLERLTPEFIKDINTYTNDRRFGLEFLSTALPQMRTIPVGRGIRPRHKVSTFDEVAELFETAEAPFAVIECICRKKKAMEEKPCKVTERKETCMGMGGIAQMMLTHGVGRENQRDEALAIIEENQKEGLVLQPSNTEKMEFICSCCGCCCGMLEAHRRMPKPVDFWASNFQARVDANACTGCGVCETHCQVDAVRVSPKTGKAAVNPHRCIGCGLCTPACPTQAIFLVKKPTESKPPKTREDLHDILMAKKKGTLGKLKLYGKLYVDALLTGQTHLLK